MIIYIILINVIGFIAMALDKHKAKRDLWRIKEATFFIISLLGGSLGVWMGMYNFHHKTKKWHFILGVPAILIVQIVVYIFLKNF